MVAIDPRNLMFNDVQYLITIVLIGSLAMILQCTCHIRNCDLKAQKDTHLLGLAMHPELVMSGFKKSFYFKDMLCKNCILWYKK